MASNSLNDLKTIFQEQTEYFNQHKYPSKHDRREKLQRLKHCLLANQQALCEAISQDFGHRSIDETNLLEFFPTIEAIKSAQKQLGKWIKPQKRRLSIWFKLAKGYVMPQPLGVVGIVVPWNYPLFLAMSPLIQAIAAGNTVMVKTSEFTPHYSALLKKIFIEAFTHHQIAIINGDAEVAKAFCDLPFNHLLFTGSTQVGKQVMQQASQHLTPVTLELGGKSPTIIGPDANEKQFNRIIIGKLLNAGQTCVAPDYVLLPQDKLDSFVHMAKQTVEKHYPNLSENTDYSSIVNQKQFVRLNQLTEDAKAKGAQIVELSETVNDYYKIAPKIVINPTDEMTIMQQEIFGPLLPVMTYENLDQAIDYVNHHARPLSLYYFGNNIRDIEKVLKSTHSGGVAINETMLHVAQENLPFGGIGPSGMGQYHGREGFNTFSKLKPVLFQSRISSFSWFYPPYGKLVSTFLKWTLR